MIRKYMNKANKIYIDRVAMQAYKDFMLYGYDDSVNDLNKRLRYIRVYNQSTVGILPASKISLNDLRRSIYHKGLDGLISRLE